MTQASDSFCFVLYPYPFEQMGYEHRDAPLQL
jgi:hypothetical protein